MVDLDLTIVSLTSTTFPMAVGMLKPKSIPVKGVGCSGMGAQGRSRQLTEEPNAEQISGLEARPMDWIVLFASLPDRQAYGPRVFGTMKDLEHVPLAQPGSEDSECKDQANASPSLETSTLIVAWSSWFWASLTLAVIVCLPLLK